MSITVQIPPDGTPASLDFEIPAPEGLVGVGAVRLHFVYGPNPPASGSFFPRLYLNGERVQLDEAGAPALTLARVALLTDSLAAPVQARVTVDEEGSLVQGSSMVLRAWGAQTESGTGALSPDGGEQPNVLTDVIEIGTIEVVSWQEWNRITGGNLGEDTGS